MHKLCCTKRRSIADDAERDGDAVEDGVTLPLALSDGDRDGLRERRELRLPLGLLLRLALVLAEPVAVTVAEPLKEGDAL